jgi:L-alanine-DL-glutamate epimerase-like enolase superfamily enzyme
VKITDVETIHINPRLAARNADQKARFSGIDTQTLFKVTADNGITGWGDTRTHVSLSDKEIEGLVGRSPFDFVNGTLAPGLMGALYDLMGKHLEVPAYKLMGQKVRDRVAVAAWTRPASPEDLAAEVQRAAAEGYMIFKIHTCAYYDVLEQNRAVEEVAPHGFKMHYDFNHNRISTDVLRLVQELEQSSVVGFLEDPLVWRDIDGWRRLREKTFIPILMHVPQLGGGPEVIHGCADLYMIGENYSVGGTLARGHACAQANVSTVLQLTGGTLTKALALHMAAVLPNVSHTINLDDQCEEDATGVRIEIAEGSSPVPEAPGLGYEVDEQLVKKLAANPTTVIPRNIGILHQPGGQKLYTLSFPSVSQQTGFAEGTVRGLRLELWNDDGSSEFDQCFERLQQEGSFRE